MLLLSSIIVESCVEDLKCPILICISFVYLTKQCRSQAQLNESIYICKSFRVSAFGKVQVTSTPAESSFFRALSLLKMYTGLQYYIYFDFRQTSKNFEGAGATKTYFREKHCFLKKGVEIWTSTPPRLPLDSTFKYKKNRRLNGNYGKGICSIKSMS